LENIFKIGSKGLDNKTDGRAHDLLKLQKR
jgi:hypothetical protein